VLGGEHALEVHIGLRHDELDARGGGRGDPRVRRAQENRDPALHGIAGRAQDRLGPRRGGDEELQPGQQVPRAVGGRQTVHVGPGWLGAVVGDRVVEVRVGRLSRERREERADLFGGAAGRGGAADV
jgi:hypothetical protein